MERIVKYAFVFLTIALWIFFGWLTVQDAEAAFTKLADPSNLPTSHGHSSSFSPDGTYLAVAHMDSPYLTIYKRSGDTFTKLSNPTTLPAGNGFGAAFSADGIYLAVAHDVSPCVTIYKRNGDTFTKLADPDTLPTTVGRGVSFITTAGGTTYLAVAHNNAPYVTIYKRNGDTFTKLADPNDLPNGYGYGVAFSADSTYLAVAHGVGKKEVARYLTIYKRSDDTFTKLSDPSSLPPNVGLGVAFSPDGAHLAVGHDSSPFVTIYSRSGDTFTKLADPDDLPTGYGFGVRFDEDGTYLAVAHDNAPYVTIYNRSGNTFTKLANPDILPTNVGCGPVFSPDGTYLAVAHDNSPYLTIYKVGPIHPTSANNGGGATTLVIDKPVGLAENDVMIANISVRGGTGVAITPPSGWDLVRRSDSNTTLAHVTYSKAAGSSEPDSYTWTLSSAERASGGIQGYRGIDTSDPINVEGGQVNGSSTSITAPSITTTVNGAMLVFGGGIAVGGTVGSYPAGLSMRYEEATSGGGATSRTTTTGGDEPQATAGSTGTRTVTMNVSKTGVSIGHLLALEPAP